MATRSGKEEEEEEGGGREVVRCRRRHCHFRLLLSILIRIIWRRGGEETTTITIPTTTTTEKGKIVVVGIIVVLFGNRKMSRQRQPKKQKNDPITIEITIKERIECSGCRSNIYPVVNDYFMVDCGNQHWLCTKCFAIKVKGKGCDHKLKCCCGKRENVFTLLKTDLIDRALASNYYDFVIEEVDEELDPVQSFKDIHSNPGFFSLTMAARREELFGRSRKKMHPLMIEPGNLSIDQASEWVIEISNYNGESTTLF